MKVSPLQRWHDYVESHDPALLQDMLHDNATFHSPVVHTPQQGKAITAAYLTAAMHVFSGNDFRYLRTFDCGERAVLEFQTEIEGISINGIDIIEWDADGLITDFKVMVRPLQAMQKLHQKMGEMLAAAKAG